VAPLFEPALPTSKLRKPGRFAYVSHALSFCHEKIWTGFWVTPPLPVEDEAKSNLVL